ncbi:MAG: CvpA family protein [Paludibacteraceae bacterium]|nr:CvpA family protein [Paludibacteraceae bacterium]MBR4563416.1 CvpA family protein [Paludibacteraceae bacterium]
MTNWLDILLLLPLVVGLVRGLMRGFVSEIIAIVVVILGVIGARLWAPPFSAWFLNQFAWPQGVCDAVAYTLLFLAIAIVLSVAARLLNKLMRAIHLGWANRLAGGLFGLAKYGLLVLVAVFVMHKTDESFHWLSDAPVVQTSVVYPQMVKLIDSIMINEKIVNEKMVNDLLPLSGQ